MSVNGNQQYPPVPPPSPQFQYAAPPPYQQYSGVYAVKPATSPIAIVSMSIGIASAAIGWAMVGFGLVLGIAAVVCGHVAMRKLATSPAPRGGRGFAIAGLITGYVGIVLGLATIGFVVYVFAVLVPSGT